MRCSTCGREAFLLSTAQQWRRDDWVYTEKFYFSSCGTMYVAEGGKTWKLQVGQ